MDNCVPLVPSLDNHEKLALALALAASGELLVDCHDGTQVADEVVESLLVKKLIIAGPRFTSNYRQYRVTRLGQTTAHYYRTH